jgi:DeoR family transcriptional regulator, glycerol-3-phosphate regulon repressor
MAQNERREQIVDLVHQNGFVTIDSLAQRFAVTPQTIRRDINELSDQALLRRYHGGAGLPSDVENVAYANRQVLLREEKARIAELVVEHIPDQASLFINIGTTTEAVAEALVRRRELRIITNNLNVATILSAREDFQVVVAGGLVRGRDRGIVGEATLDFINQFRVEYAIIGISGIDMDGTLLDFDYREVRISQAIIANARWVYLVADHSKFGRHAMVGEGNLTQVSALFTDQPPPAPIRELIAANGVDLFVADG